MAPHAEPRMACAATTGSTVADLIITAIASFGERPSFENDEGQISYSKLGGLISQIAQYFDELGLCPGDTVAQLGVNRYEVFAVIAAAYLRGLRSVTLHALGSQSDHDYILGDCDAKVVIVDEYHRVRGEALRGRCESGRTWLSIGSIPGSADLMETIRKFAPAPLRPVGDGETVVRIAYTGGTTGRPKGVMLSNRALSMNAMLDLAAKEWPEGVRYLCAAPISHGGGSLVVPTLMRGGCITMLRSFSPGALVDAITRHSCNATWLVPTMLYALLDSPRSAEIDWSKFHSLVYSGAPASPTRINQALAMFGPVLVQSYGQTEAPNSILVLTRQDHVSLVGEQLAAAGRPFPLLRVALLDEEGIEVPDGERGEVCVRGPLLMSGYLNKAQETASALAGDWLHTGDIAYKGDDGLYYIVDRKKDVIISGGFNVYPKEIEDALCSHPSVAAASVIGVPDDKWGEAVMAYVQLKPGRLLDVEEAIAAVRHAKGPVAAPKKVAIVDYLPMTALGKLDKKALRARHWADSPRAVH